MKIYKHSYKTDNQCTINLVHPIDKVCIFDIETTGLSPINSMIYMIGFLCLDKNAAEYSIIQLFADSPSDEAAIIKEFLTFIKDYKCLIHFNGDSFDIPFIKKRIELLKIESFFTNFESYDMLKFVKRFKCIFNTENLKQKTIEAFLGIHRNDIYSGKELIKIYKDYVISKEPEAEKLLLLHNHDDLKGLYDIMPAYNYSQLLNSSYVVSYELLADCIIFKLEFTHSFPKDFSINTGYFYALGYNNTFKIKVPILAAELKYFFDDYKNYYYLPIEDTAIHKSVAQFVDKDYRKNATKATCYTKKSAIFIKCFSTELSPVFKEAYNSKDTYIELNDNFLSDKLSLNAYISDCVHNLLS